MPHDFIPKSDNGLIMLLRTFVSAAEEHAAELGFTPEELASLRAVRDDAIAKMANHVLQHSLARGAAAAKEESLRCAEQTIRATVRRLRAMPEATPDVVQRFGVPPLDTVRSRPAAHSPTDLAVESGLGGQVTLRWRPNGNTRGTIYIVEGRAEEEPAFATLGFTTRTRWSHTVPRAVRMMHYRVRARHGDLESGYCDAGIGWE